MKTVRTAIRRLFADARPTEQSVHFHRRGDTPAPCYDEGCPIPRLSV